MWRSHDNPDRPPGRRARCPSRSSSSVRISRGRNPFLQSRRLGLLYDLHTEPTERAPCRSLLCAGRLDRCSTRCLRRGQRLQELQVRHRADSRRPHRPRDHDPKDVLTRFGLAPYGPSLSGHGHHRGSIRSRAACGFSRRRPRFGASRTRGSLNLRRVAPRRRWIAARLIAEHGLHPTPVLIESARSSFEAAAPRGAPGRSGAPGNPVLAAPRGAALAVDPRGRRTGPSVPGTQAVHLARLDQLLSPSGKTLGSAWAATAGARSLARTHSLALARRIERLQAKPPARPDGRPRSGKRGSGRASCDSKGLPQALTVWAPPALIAGTLKAMFEHWDGATLAWSPSRSESARSERPSAFGRGPALALARAAVMERLGAGPGRHVGQSLGHRARFVAANPSANARKALAVSLAPARRPTPLRGRSPAAAGRAPPPARRDSASVRCPPTHPAVRIAYKSASAVSRLP